MGTNAHWRPTVISGACASSCASLGAVQTSFGRPSWVACPLSGTGGWETVQPPTSDAPRGMGRLASSVASSSERKSSMNREVPLSLPLSSWLSSNGSPNCGANVTRHHSEPV